MSFDEARYVNADEKVVFFRVIGGGYNWGGCLYEVRGGGQDLFLDYGGSDFESVDLEKITWLRHQAGEQRVIFVTSFPEPKVDKSLLNKAGEALARWVEDSLGIKLGRYRVERVET